MVIATGSHLVLDETEGLTCSIDFNYDTEPLPGHFPSRVGMPLLKESRMNHLGKLMFQWFYWHASATADQERTLQPAQRGARAEHHLESRESRALVRVS